MRGKVSSVLEEDIYGVEQDDPLAMSEPPATPQIIVVAKPVQFYDALRQEKVETFALKVKCNRSKVEKVTECFEYFNKYNDTCNFIPQESRTRTQSNSQRG